MRERYSPAIHLALNQRISYFGIFQLQKLPLVTNVFVSITLYLQVLDTQLKLALENIVIHWINWKDNKKDLATDPTGHIYQDL